MHWTQKGTTCQSQIKMFAVQLNSRSCKRTSIKQILILKCIEVYWDLISRARKFPLSVTNSPPVQGNRIIYKILLCNANITVFIIYVFTFNLTVCLRHWNKGLMFIILSNSIYLRTSSMFNWCWALVKIKKNVIFVVFCIRVLSMWRHLLHSFMWCNCQKQRIHIDGIKF